MTRLQLPPATGAIVRDNLPKHRREGGSVDSLTLPNGDGTRGLVVVSARDNAVWVRHNRAVIQEHIDPLLGRQQRADVSVKREIRLARALDGLNDFWVSGVN